MSTYTEYLAQSTTSRCHQQASLVKKMLHVFPQTECLPVLKLLSLQTFVSKHMVLHVQGYQDCY